MSHTFQHDYAVLDLEKDADWETTQSRYRQQVQIWHPDRFTRRPREAVYAQNKFIELSTAYRNLRRYHQLNRSMPFENASNLESWNEQASNKKGSSGSHAKYSDRKTSTISNRAILYESLLSNANRSQRRSLKNTEFSEHWRWAIPVILMLVGTVGLFIYTDKRQKQQVVERSKIEQAVEQQ